MLKAVYLPGCIPKPVGKLLGFQLPFPPEVPTYDGCMATLLRCDVAYPNASRCAIQGGVGRFLYFVGLVGGHLIFFGGSDENKQR